MLPIIIGSLGDNSSRLTNLNMKTINNMTVTPCKLYPINSVYVVLFNIKKFPITFTINAVKNIHFEVECWRLLKFNTRNNIALKNNNPLI